MDSRYNQQDLRTNSTLNDCLSLLEDFSADDKPDPADIDLSRSHGRGRAKNTYVRNEESAKRNYIALCFCDFQGKLTVVSTGADERSRAPYLPEEIVGLSKPSAWDSFSQISC